MSNVKKGDTFNIAHTVIKNGTYICVPCGYKKYFKEGEVFPSCFSCLRGKKYKDDIYMKDLGLWEFIGIDMI